MIVIKKKNANLLVSPVKCILALHHFSCGWAKCYQLTSLKCYNFLFSSVFVIWNISIQSPTVIRKHYFIPLRLVRLSIDKNIFVKILFPLTFDGIIHWRNMDEIPWNESSGKNFTPYFWLQPQDDTQYTTDWRSRNTKTALWFNKKVHSCFHLILCCFV